MHVVDYRLWIISGDIEKRTFKLDIIKKVEVLLCSGGKSSVIKHVVSPSTSRQNMFKGRG